MHTALATLNPFVDAQQQLEFARADLLAMSAKLHAARVKRMRRRVFWLEQAYGTKLDAVWAAQEAAN